MKKILSLFAFVGLMALGANAQGVSGGLKLGLNLSNATISNSGFTTSPSFRTTFHGGAYLTMMLSEKFGVQPELLYSGQGAKNGNYTLKMSYITVPVLLRFNFTEVFSMHLGPQVGILASAKSDFNGESTDIKDSFKGTDFSGALGLGVDLPMGLNFGFRFVKGFSNTLDGDTEGTKQKNYGLQFSVGYKLFGKK